MSAPSVLWSATALSTTSNITTSAATTVPFPLRARQRYVNSIIIVDSDGLICKTYPVKAGDTVGFTVRDVLGHPGPLFAYMSKSTVANVSAYQGEGDWFKIYEMGVKTYANYSLAMTWLSDGWTKFDFKIPKDIENGQYLLRAEHIAVHSAGGPDGAGAQFYIGCAQIDVSGATGKKPSPVGKFPGICKCILHTLSLVASNSHHQIAHATPESTSAPTGRP